MDFIAEEQQLFRSCEILFGDHLKISREFLEYLQLSGLKGAYRKRAMETHPDALIGSDLQSAPGSSDRFHRVQKAYEQLFRYLKIKESRLLQARYRQFTNEPPRPTAGPSPFSRSTCGNPGYAATENLYHGPLPHRRLLFGHFLYYSGLANWRTIARILTWQRTERPRLGELGKRLGMLKPADIALILQNNGPSQPFGQTAMRLRILSAYQLRVLIFQQQRLQKKFGVILLEKDLVTQEELEELLYQFEQHNASI